MAETDEPTTTPIVEEPPRAELLGSNNWEGLLHPLNLSLRRLILLSGDFCQCTYDSLSLVYSMNCFCFQTSRFFSTISHTRAQSLSISTLVKANAVRGLGNLARSIQFTKQLPVHGDPLDSMNSKFEYPDAQGSKAHMKERSHLFPTSSGGSDWLEQMVQAFLSCVTTGNVKVQWNVCHALSNLFLNKALKLHLIGG